MDSCQTCGDYSSLAKTWSGASSLKYNHWSPYPNACAGANNSVEHYNVGNHYERRRMERYTPEQYSKSKSGWNNQKC
jgi:hypothetical protein